MQTMTIMNFGELVLLKYNNIIIQSVMIAFRFAIYIYIYWHVVQDMCLLNIVATFIFRVWGL